MDKYYVDRLELVDLELGQIFVEEAVPEELSKQFSLTDFMRGGTERKPIQ